MAKNKEIKTNAMRLLETKKIPYEAHTYECDEFVDGIQIADMLGLPHEKVYKTLVTQGNSKNYFVFVIPIEAELDMKKAAKSVGEKSVAMLHVKDINAVTGYIRGGCTAIGMKKQYVTRIDESAQALSAEVSWACSWSLHHRIWQKQPMQNLRILQRKQRLRYCRDMEEDT